jgi:carbon-monoxide dehydrogenase large subunit
VAETRYAAEDALSLIEVDYEPLDVIVDAEEAAADGALQLHENAPATSSWTGTSATPMRPTGARRGGRRRQPAAREPAPDPEPDGGSRRRSAVRGVDRRLHRLDDLAGPAHHAAADDGVRVRDPETKMRCIALHVGGGFGRRSSSTTSTC